MEYGIAIAGQVQEQRFETAAEAHAEATLVRVMLGGRARVAPVHVEKFLAR